MSWTRDEERQLHPASKPRCRHLPTCSQRLWPRFDRYLQGRGLSSELARANTWFPSRTIDGYDRLVVPGTSSETGNLYWQARLIDPDSHARRWESPHGVSRGDSLCLVWPGSPRLGGRSVVVEGPLDALAAAEEGFLAIGLMGVTPGYDVILNAARILRGTECMVMSDVAAEAEMCENMMRLVELGIKCKFLSPYPDKDLAAMTKLRRREALRG